MDSLQSLLALVVLSAPLVAAAGVAASALTEDRRLARRLAMLGAAISFCAALVAFVRICGGGLDVESPLGLGVWLTMGPRDPLQIAFAIAMDLPAAALAAVMSLSTLCAVALSRPGSSNRSSERFLYISALLLLSTSLGIVLSTNAGELFVFWQIAAVSAYLMKSAAAETTAEAVAAKRFILTQRVAEFWLLCAVLALGVAYQTLDFADLFQNLRAHAMAQRFALVHFIGLCLLGACVGRCALIPFPGWIAGFASGPALTTILVEGICLMPAGVLLLIRFLPVLHAASAAASFAVFLGGLSAFVAAVCAWAETDVRRQAGFACASVLGIMILGLSLPTPAAGAWGVVLLATFVPTSSAVLGWFAERSRTPVDNRLPENRAQMAGIARGAAAVAAAAAIVLLFSGICGQGGILAAGLAAVATGIGQGHTSLVLALLLALGAQFFAALAMTRALLAGRSALEVSVSFSSPAFEANPFDARPVSSKGSSWPMVVLAACGGAVGLVAGASILAGRLSPDDQTGALTLAGGSVVATLVGCLPALAGFLAGWQRPLSGRADRTSQAGDSVLMRLGRKRFYCDAFLLLIVLPIRALAQFARFVDWFFVDGFVSGAPASAVEAAGHVLEPVQGRSVSFYVASAAVGTALLAAVVVWLQ